jgi:hypothetical protein
LVFYGHQTIIGAVVLTAIIKFEWCVLDKIEVKYTHAGRE